MTCKLITTNNGFADTVDGGYTEWTAWMKCSKSCGGGVVKRFRNCTSPPPQYGGRDCSVLGPEILTEACNNMHCPGL